MLLAHERPDREGDHISQKDDAPTLSWLVKTSNMKEDVTEILLFNGRDTTGLPELPCVA